MTNPTPNAQIIFSQTQKEQQEQIRREKKLFSDNLEAIATGKVSWPELRAQTFDPVPTSEPVSMADQAYQSREHELQSILEFIRQPIGGTTPDPGSAA